MGFDQYSSFGKNKVDAIYCSPAFSLRTCDILRDCRKPDMSKPLIACQYLGYKQFSRHCDICKDFRFKIPAIHCSTHKFSVLDLRSSNNTGHLFLLFFFQFSFFLWIKLGLFLLFPFAFVFFPLITHICFSLFESDYTDLDIITIVMLSVFKFHRLSYQKTK